VPDQAPRIEQSIGIARIERYHLEYRSRLCFVLRGASGKMLCKAEHFFSDCADREISPLRSSARVNFFWRVFPPHDLRLADIHSDHVSD
jgi:hypothetical protein